MRSATIILVLLSISIAGNTRADKPATPATRTQLVADGKFIFVMLTLHPSETELAEATRAKYPQSGLYKNDGSKEALWTVDWYRQKVSVLPDGVHMVRHGWWPSRKGGMKNLAIAEAELKQEAVSFFAKGKLLREYAIAELVDDPTKLRSTVSHFHWMKSSETFEGKLEFELVTHDANRIRFDATSGKIIEKKKAD